MRLRDLGRQRHKAAAKKKRGGVVYHDVSSRAFKCHCGNGCRWAPKQAHLTCGDCGAKHHRGVDLRPPNPATEIEKAAILQVSRYTLWRYRQGIAGRIPPGRKPKMSMLLSIKRIDREFRNRAKKEDEKRAARGER